MVILLDFSEMDGLDHLYTIHVIGSPVVNMVVQIFW